MKTKIWTIEQYLGEMDRISFKLFGRSITDVHTTPENKEVCRRVLESKFKIHDGK